MQSIGIKVYQDIMKLCSIALVKKSLGVIYGLAGTGKSTALMDFKAQHDGQVTYLRADPTLSKREMLREICEHLELSPHGTMRGLERRIVWKLNQTGKHVLVVDEADRLGGGSPLYWFEILRTLYDLCPGVSLIVAGEEGLMDILERDPRQRDGFRRFYSRITARYPTSKRQQRQWVLMEAADAKLVIEAYHLAEIEAPAMRQLTTIGREGGVRKLCNTLENLKMMPPDGPITAQAVRRAEHVLGF